MIIVTAIVTWGLSDRYTWLDDKLRQDGTQQRPLPLDSQLNRKPAWYAAKALEDAPQR